MGFHHKYEQRGDGNAMTRCTAIALVLLLVLGSAVGSLGQELASAEQESEMSRILRRAGSLLLRESHYLPTIETMSGEDIEARILVAKDLLGAVTGADVVVVGLVLSIEEEYSERTAYIDEDEIDGLIASLEYLEQYGAAVLSSPLATSTGETGVSSEIHFTTKDGMVLGVLWSSGRLLYAVKVTSLADWAFLSDEGRSTLLSNLRSAQDTAHSL